MLHAITQKGRGFQPALEGQKKFHGLGPYDPETGETKVPGQKTYSEIFAEALGAFYPGGKDPATLAILNRGSPNTVR